MNLTDLIDKLKNKTTDTIVDIGDILQYALPFAALFVIAAQGRADLVWNWLYIIAGQAGLSTILKKIFNFTPLGTRPNGGENSMPSGHTTAAFAGAAIIFRVDWFAGLIALPFAAFTGYSRVRGYAHHWRDVIVGALLGAGSAYGIPQLINSIF
jgi:membrane-associated phospholipid phosphatase